MRAKCPALKDGLYGLWSTYSYLTIISVVIHASFSLFLSLRFPLRIHFRPVPPSFHLGLRAHFLKSLALTHSSERSYKGGIAVQRDAEDLGFSRWVGE